MYNYYASIYIRVRFLTVKGEEEQARQQSQRDEVKVMTRVQGAGDSCYLAKRRREVRKASRRVDLGKTHLKGAEGQVGQWHVWRPDEGLWLGAEAAEQGPQAEGLD